MKNTEMKELNLNEMENINGGYLHKFVVGWTDDGVTIYRYYFIDDYGGAFLGQVVDTDDRLPLEHAAELEISGQFITYDQWTQLRQTGVIRD